MILKINKILMAVVVSVINVAVNLGNFFHYNVVFSIKSRI